MDKTFQDIHILDRNNEEYIKRECKIKNIRFDTSWSPYIEIIVIVDGEEQKLYVPITSGMKLLID